VVAALEEDRRVLLEDLLVQLEAQPAIDAVGAEVVHEERDERVGEQVLAGAVGHRRQPGALERQADHHRVHVRRVRRRDHQRAALGHRAQLLERALDLDPAVELGEQAADAAAHAAASARTRSPAPASAPWSRSGTPADRSCRRCPGRSAPPARAARRPARRRHPAEPPGQLAPAPGVLAPRPSSRLISQTQTSFTTYSSDASPPAARGWSHALDDAALDLAQHALAVGVEAVEAAAGLEHRPITRHGALLIHRRRRRCRSAPAQFGGWSPSPSRPAKPSASPGTISSIPPSRPRGPC
jgi:ribosomal protein L21